MIYIYDSDRYSRARSGTVLVKHIAHDQAITSSDRSPLCSAKVTNAVRYDSDDPNQRRLVQHITCAGCEKAQRQAATAFQRKDTPVAKSYDLPTQADVDVETDFQTKKLFLRVGDDRIQLDRQHTVMLIQRLASALGQTDWS